MVTLNNCLKILSILIFVFIILKYIVLMNTVESVILSCIFAVSFIIIENLLINNNNNNNNINNIPKECDSCSINFLKSSDENILVLPEYENKSILLNEDFTSIDSVDENYEFKCFKTKKENFNNLCTSNDEYSNNSSQSNMSNEQQIMTQTELQKLSDNLVKNLNLSQSLSETKNEFEMIKKNIPMTTIEFDKAISNITKDELNSLEENPIVNNIINNQNISSNITNTPLPMSTPYTSTLSQNTRVPSYVQSEMMSTPVPNTMGTTPVPNTMGTTPAPMIITQTGTTPVPNTMGTTPVPNTIGTTPAPMIRTQTGTTPAPKTMGTTLAPMTMTQSEMMSTSMPMTRSPMTMTQSEIMSTSMPMTRSPMTMTQSEMMEKTRNEPLASNTSQKIRNKIQETQSEMIQNKPMTGEQIEMMRNKLMEKKRSEMMNRNMIETNSENINNMFVQDINNRGGNTYDVDSVEYQQDGIQEEEGDKVLNNNLFRMSVGNQSVVNKFLESGGKYYGDILTRSTNAPSKFQAATNELKYGDFNYIAPLNKGMINPEYTFVSPSNWYPIPPHPPVCVTNKSCTTCPIIIGDGKDYMQYASLDDFDKSRRFTGDMNINIDYIKNVLNNSNGY